MLLFRTRYSKCIILMKQGAAYVMLRAEYITSLVMQLF